MPHTTTAKKATQKTQSPESTTSAQDLGTTSEHSKLKKELDDILDEIEEVLVENAEAFVSSYRQKGGE